MTDEMLEREYRISLLYRLEGQTYLRNREKGFVDIELQVQLSDLINRYRTGFIKDDEIDWELVENLIKGRICHITMQKINEVLKSTPVPKPKFPDVVKQSLDHLGIKYVDDDD